MAAMTTALTEFSDNGNSRTWTLSGHTVSEPQIVIQKRKVPSGNQVVAEDTVTVLYATTDSDGNVLPQRVSMSATVRRPIGHDSVDLTAVLGIFRDIVAGDEFTSVTTTQNFLV